jgi:anti-anti-sigma factor
VYGAAPTPALGGHLTTDRIVQAAIATPQARDPAPVVEVERFDTRAVVTLCGDLDLIVERQVMETIAGAIAMDGLRSLHIDATRVTFIDSSGLRSLLLSREAVLDEGLEFSLAIAATGSVSRLLVLAGVHTVLADELVTRTPVYEGPDALAG